jgi:hypothetical protein
MEGFEPTLDRLSTYCLCQLGYKGVIGSRALELNQVTSAYETELDIDPPPAIIHSLIRYAGSAGPRYVPCRGQGTLIGAS